MHAIQSKHETWLAACSSLVISLIALPIMSGQEVWNFKIVVANFLVRLADFEGVVTVNN